MVVQWLQVLCWIQWIVAPVWDTVHSGATLKIKSEKHYKWAEPFNGSPAEDQVECFVHLQLPSNLLMHYNMKAQVQTSYEI